MRPPILLLTPLFEDQDLLCAVVLDDCRLDLRIGDERIANLDVPVVFDEQHIAQLNFSTHFSGYLFKPNRLSGRHAVLLSARSDHGVHSELLLTEDKQKVYSFAPGSSARKLAEYALQARRRRGRTAPRCERGGQRPPLQFSFCLWMSFVVFGPQVF